MGGRQGKLVFALRSDARSFLAPSSVLTDIFSLLGRRENRCYPRKFPYLTE